MQRRFGWVLAAVTVTLAGASGRAQAPTHVYTLNNTLTDVLGGPSLVDNGGAFASVNGRDGYAFGPNQGPSLSGAINPNVYSVELFFTLADVSGWQKIIDFKDRTSDRGVYARPGGGHVVADLLDFTSPVFTPNAIAHLIVTRDAAHTVSSYVDGVLLGTFNDAATSPPFATAFTGPGNILRLFQDDLVTPGSTDAGSGSLDYVRLYDRALAPTEVATRYDDRFDELADVSAVPEPLSLSLLGSGLGVLGVVALRRRVTR
jgi:hypothetical protein